MRLSVSFNGVVSKTECAALALALVYFIRPEEVLLFCGGGTGGGVLVGVLSGVLLWNCLALKGIVDFDDFGVVDS